MPQPTIEYCQQQQAEIAEWIGRNGYHSGAPLGLFDWVAEELILADELRKKETR